MIREPLWDLAGRTVSVGSEVSNTIEALLRLQNTADHQRPITLYLIGTPTTTSLPPTDALMLCSLIRTLRSPVQTVGMGTLHHLQPMILAAGTHRRYLLRHSLVALSPIKWESVPAARPAMSFDQPVSPRSARSLLETQLEQFLHELKLDPELFETERLLTAEEAVEHRLADIVVAHTPPQLPPKQELLHETQR